VVRRTFSPARAWRRAVVSRLPQTLGCTKCEPVAKPKDRGDSVDTALVLRAHGLPRLQVIGSLVTQNASFEWRAFLVCSACRPQTREKSAVLSASLWSALRASVLRRAVSWLASPSTATSAWVRFVVCSVQESTARVGNRESCSTKRSLRSAWVARSRTLLSTGEPTARRQARAGGTRYIFASPGLAACRRLPVTSNVRHHKHRIPQTRPF
jgi:hypothetical protein